MEKILTSIKNKIAWVEKEQDSLSEREKQTIMLNLKLIDNELARCMLLHIAVNR
jgi:hypothetical protein